MVLKPISTGRYDDNDKGIVGNGWRY